MNKMFDYLYPIDRERRTARTAAQGWMCARTRARVRARVGVRREGQEDLIRDLIEEQVCTRWRKFVPRLYAGSGGRHVAAQAWALDGNQFDFVKNQ